jgi:hypothetical protein
MDALLEVAGPGTGSPLLLVELRHLGGALARPTPDAGALATLEGSFALLAGGIATSPDATASIRANLRSLFNSLRKWDTGRGYANFAENLPTDTPAALTHPAPTSDSHNSKPKSTPTACSSPTTPSQPGPPDGPGCLCHCTSGHRG